MKAPTHVGILFGHAEAKCTTVLQEFRPQFFLGNVKALRWSHMQAVRLCDTTFEPGFLGM